MKANIAISFSGGGFRAATFHLGAISYLNHLKTDDGTPLLDHVSAVSTVSGGTLTGLWLILGKCRGLSNEEIISQLRKILMESDVIGRASTEFLCGKNNNNSLIREMTKIYDEEIFKGATMGDLMDHIEEISIDDFSANATEFTNATEFRFQVGKKIKTAKGGTSQGVIGNNYYKIPQDIARQIKLSEVFAASSCFPGGFEALFFPRDFKLNEKEENAEYLAKVEPIALMDGGIIDNEGIEPIVLLRKRRDIDMFVISDAGCGKDKTYYYEESNIMPYLTIHKINIGLNIGILLFAQFLLWVPKGFWFGFFLGWTIIFLILRLSTALASRKIIKQLAKKVPFRFNWKGLLHIPLSKWINLISSRATSMLALTQDMFLKHIRSLNYATIYNDESWQNRRIMNALYELSTGKNWGKHLTEEEEVLMEPSDAIFKVSDLATSMGTTLWWSNEDRTAGKPQAVIAAGQYNLCWNLLEYIYRLRRDNSNLNENHQVILNLQEKLEADWQKFKDNPYWMVEE